MVVLYVNMIRKVSSLKSRKYESTDKKDRAQEYCPRTFFVKTKTVTVLAAHLSLEKRKKIKAKHVIFSKKFAKNEY